MQSLQSQTYSNTTIRAFTVNCDKLTTYKQLISVSKSIHNTNNSKLTLYDTTNPIYFATFLRSETRLKITAQKEGKGEICHFTNYSHFQHFSEPESDHSKNFCDHNCVHFDVKNCTDNYYNFTFSLNRSSYYTASILIPDIQISSLEYTFTTERNRYNMTNFANGIAFNVRKRNFSLPFSRSCLMLQLDRANENRSDFINGHHFSLTGVQEPNETKSIAIIILCLVVLFYLLFLYIMVCARYLWK